MKLENANLEKVAKEKMPRKKKTWLVIALTVLPVLVLGLALGLIFGLSTTKQLDISLQGNGSFIVQDQDGNELKGEDGKYTLANGTTVSVVVTPEDGKEIESITLNKEKVEITAAPGESQTVLVEKIDKNTTIEVVFEIRTFDVTFVGFEGANLGTQKVEYGNAATDPTAPAVEGHTFKNWDKDFSNITSNLTVTAVYEINTYTVTFKDWDEKVLSEQTINWNEDATVPNNPTREGHRFLGWFDGETKVEDFSKITENLTVKAKYIEQFAVIFQDWNGTQIGEVQTLDKGSFATAPADPERTGYTFTGWDVAFDNITANTTVTAVYTINTYEISTAVEGEGTIDFASIENGEVKEEKYTYGANVSFKITAAEGYYIAGIYVNGSDETISFDVISDGSYAYTFENVTDNKTIKVNFAKITVTLVTPANGTITTTADLDNLNYGDEIEITFTPATGYYVGQILVDGKAANGETTEGTNVQSYTLKVTGSHAVVATYTISQYSVTVEQEEGGSIEPEEISGEVDYGTEISFTFTPAAGYYVKEILIDGTSVYAATSQEGEIKTHTLTVTKNHTVTAAFAIKSFTVTFVNYDGTEIDKQTVNYGDSATAPNATREGHTFVGWYTNPEDNTTGVEDFSNITADLTVTAIYEIKKYTVTFQYYSDFAGETLVEETQTVEHGNAATAPTATRVGYDITGWDKDYSYITEDLTVTAIYEIKTYTVTFQYYSDFAGETLVKETQTVDHGSSATAPNATRDGYTFVGWYTNPEDNTTGVEDFSNITADLTVTAIYEIKTFEISTDITGEGTVSDETTVEYNQSTTLTITPDEGHYIVSVTIDGSVQSLYDPTYVTNGGSYEIHFNDVTENHTVEVLFVEKDTSFQFYSVDGSGVGQVGYIGPSDVTSLTIPSIVSGYSVRGFYGEIPASVEELILEGDLTQGILLLTEIDGIKYEWVDLNESIVEEITTVGTYTRRLVSEEPEIPEEPEEPVVTLVYTGLDANGNATADESAIVAYMIGDGSEYLNQGNGYNGTGADIVIPSTYNGKPVTTIWQGAFWRFAGAITFEEGTIISSLGSEAFSGCTGTISGLVLGGGITQIPAYAFEGCTGLTSITIPATITTIGQMAFSDCTGLTELTINGDLTGVVDNAFSGCTNLKTLNIGGEVTSLPADLFTTHLTNLTTINVNTDALDGKEIALPAAGDGYVWYRDDNEGVTTIEIGGIYTKVEV